MTTQLTAQDLIELHTSDDINLSDTGNGRRYELLCRDVVRYVEDIDRWGVWNGRHLELDGPKALNAYALTTLVIRQVRDEGLALSEEDAGERRQQLLTWAMRCEGVGHRRRMLEEAMSRPALRVREENLDERATDLVVRNGTVDLRTGELRPSVMTDLNSRCCNVAYHPNAKSKLLDHFLDTFLPDELDQRCIWAILGRALMGHNQARLFPIIWGDSTSGKSQLVAALDRILGTYITPIGSSVFRGNLDDKPRPDLVKAMYTRIAYAVEASKSWSLHADQIKRLTGGDAFPYRDLFSGVVKAFPRFTPLLVTNVMPRITNIDPAIKRRTLVIHFDRSIPVALERTEYKDRFLNDTGTLEAILACLVRGARDELAAKVENIPQKYALATLNAFGQMDHVDEFLEWMVDSGYLEFVDDETPANACALLNQLHAWYKNWLKKHGDKMDQVDALGLREFNAKLVERGWEKKNSGGLRWLGRKLTVSAESFLVL